MAKNTSLAWRQRQLEAKLQVAWAKVACSVLRSMAGGAIDGDPVEAMREFVAVHDAAETENTNPKGVPIRMVSLERGDDLNLHTNKIVRGSLRMVAARLEQGAASPGPCPGVPTGTAYDAARLEVVSGIRLLLEEDAFLPLLVPCDSCELPHLYPCTTKEAKMTKLLTAPENP